MTKRFTTIDSLTEITLLRDNAAYFVRYHSFSPLTVARNDKRRGKISQHVGYIIKEQGFGKYILDSIGLKLIFEHSTKTIDSTAVTILPTDPKAKTIKVEFRPMAFYAKIYRPELINWQIFEEDGTMHDNIFEEIVVEVPKKTLPKTFMVKTLEGEFPLKVTARKNQVFSLYINEYNLFPRSKIANRQFLMKELIEIKNVL